MFLLLTFLLHRNNISAGRHNVVVNSSPVSLLAVFITKLSLYIYHILFIAVLLNLVNKFVLK